MPEDAFQAPEDDKAEAEDDALVILPENTDTLRVWLAVDTQWRWAYPAMDKPRCEGLRYGAVESTINMLELTKHRKRIFEGIIDMERAALPILNG